MNRFLEFNEYRILEGYGSISRKQAEEKAFAEYDKFNKTQRIESDFDKAVTNRSLIKKGGNMNNKLSCFSCLSWLKFICVHRCPSVVLTSNSYLRGLCPMIDIWFKNDLRDIYEQHTVAVFIDESGDAEFLLKTLERNTLFSRQIPSWKSCM